ncbi:MAG: prepilin peptidase [Alphaproteobacteria bacterium]|nr:prepilin peptidase [Alphaproteobacteria bacterium]
MVFYILLALIFGLFTPYTARRFAKFMPATFAGALFEIFRPTKKVSLYRRNKLYKKLVWRSIVEAFAFAIITYLAYIHFGVHGFGFIAMYIWLLLLMAEIDFRIFLLPDILTVPLLLLGFLASSLNMGFVAFNESAIGAFIGYFLPVLVSLLIVWRNKDAFGGGDIKLLSALGAWLGVEGLLYVIVLASVLGIVYSLIRKKSVLAFGPMIALSGIVVAFWLF